MAPKGPGSLEGLVRMWKICVILVLPGLQMSSHYVDTHIPHICHKHHKRCLCKNFLSGVNFSRLSEKKLQKWLKTDQMMAIFSHKWLMLWRKKHIFINPSWQGGYGPILSSFEVLEVPKLHRSSTFWPGLLKTPAPLKTPGSFKNMWPCGHTWFLNLVPSLGPLWQWQCKTYFSWLKLLELIIARETEAMVWMIILMKWLSEMQTL